MTFKVWRRHNRDVCDSTNRYDPRCGCPLHVQFVWKGAPGVFEGKKLTYQNKWSLETRIPEPELASVVELLLWFGVLGIFVSEDEERYSYQFEHDPKRMTAGLTTYAYCVHPAFRMALGCTN
jgi:hypothetical protein